MADIHRLVDEQGIRPAAKKHKIPEASLRLHLKHRETSPAPARRPAKPATPPEPPAASKAPPAPPAAPLPPPPEPTAAEPDLPLDDLDGRIRQLNRSADRLRVAAEHGPLRERGAALNACRAATAEAVALAAKRDQGREPELLTSKAWVELRRELVEALVSFPDAAAAVAQVLRRVEAA